MFVIDSATMKPNHELMRRYAEGWAKRGFRFDSTVWSELTNRAEMKAEELRSLGLKNPNSPREIEMFFRSFNSLEIAAQLYDLKKAQWNLTVVSLCEAADKFYSIPEMRTLFEYKAASATARSFKALERFLTDGQIAHPKVTSTITNRIMFVEPCITGLPKICRPFLPIVSDAVLLSVDVKSQEPRIIVNWFGSPDLRRIASTESDIYTGVSKAAFIPKVKAYESAGESITPVGRGGAWLWGAGDALVHLEDVYQSIFGLPELVVGVFESGVRRKLPVRWGVSHKGVVTGEILPGALTYRLLPEERTEVKKIWNLLAYGGAKATAKALGTLVDGVALADYIKAELKESPPKHEKSGVYTYFGTPIVYTKRTNYKSSNNSAIQGTGADLMALLVEKFYSEKRPEGMDIYFTRYDEIILQVPCSFINKNGGEGTGSYFRELFEHQVDGFTPFAVDVELF